MARPMPQNEDEADRQLKNFRALFLPQEQAALRWYIRHLIQEDRKLTHRDQRGPDALDRDG
jgi:hypothetical protein